jgi:hypothetical protein
VRELLFREDGASFYAPFDTTLVKAADEDGRWIIYLEASNEQRDQDGDVIAMKALQEQSAAYLQKGVISWDHKHKQMHDPAYIIGEPLEVKFTDDRRTLVKGFLYQENDKAQSVWKNLKSGTTRFGSSVGGYILNKSKEQNVSKVIWDETAITYKPVNDSVLGAVRVLPFAAFAKALMVGSGVDAAQFTGGRALVNESLQGATGTVDTVAVADGAVAIEDSQLLSLFREMWHAIRSGEVDTFDELLAFVMLRGYNGSVAAEIVRFVLSKLPEAAQKIREV